MKYIPLKAQLAALLACPETRDELKRSWDSTNADPDGYMSDILHGEAFINNQSDLFTGDYDIALSLFVDGFSPFSHSTTSMTIVHLIILNYHPTDR